MPDSDSVSERQPQAAAPVKPPGLARELGLGIAVAVVVGNVIGSGIFLKPGNIAAASGDFRVILSVWVAGGLLCVLGGLCFAELAAMLPHAGGLYVYLREAYGRPVAFLYGWTDVVFGKPASIGALAVAFTSSLCLALGAQPPALIQVGLAVLLIGSMTIVNILGVVWGGRLQFVITLIKAGFLALVAVIPFLLLPLRDSTIELANYTSTIVPRESGLARQIGVVMLAVMWAYNGWDGVTTLSEETRNPQRNIPLSLFIGIGILIVLYVSANVAYHGVLSMDEMRAAGDHAAEQMLGKLLGQPGLATMSAVIMCSTFGAINTNLLQAPRITFAMGRDGTFLRTLGTVHATFRTPMAAILLLAGMAILLVVGVEVAKQLVAVDPAAIAPVAESAGAGTDLWSRTVESLRTGSTFDLLTNFVIFALSVFYMLGVLAVIVLRMRLPNANRPYRTWGYPIVPVLFLAVNVWFLWQVYGTNPLEARAGLFIMALGIPAYLMFRRSG